MIGLAVSRLAPLRALLAPGRRRALLRVGAALAAVAAAACTEKLESGAGCPSLCPDQNVAVLDTIIEPITAGFGTLADSGAVDTTLTGYPGIGVETSLLLADRSLNGDGLRSYGVVRFDTLVKTFNKGGDTTITRADSVYLQIFVDTVSARRRVSGPVTLELYDVDTVQASDAADTSVAALAPLFRADRLVGSRTFQPSELRDSVQIPLSATRLLAALASTTGSRLRLGLRANGNGQPVQLRVRSVEAGYGALLNYDPSPDTAVHPIRVGPSSKTPTSNALAGLRGALADFTLAVDPTGSEPNTVLQVGGVPGRRAFLRFHIPPRIIDSATVIRATLLLTQRPSARAQAQDSVTVQPLLVVANPRLSIGRAADVLDYNTAVNFGLDTLRLVAGDSGVRSFEMVRVVRAWKTAKQSTLQRALVLRSVREGELPVEALFFSSDAADPLVRPRLRLSYVPNTQLGSR